MQAGGFIAEGRVNGSLNLSRALGDMEYKQSPLPPGEQMVTAMPEIRSLDLEPGHEFILLACDGIWDVLTNQEVSRPQSDSSVPQAYFGMNAVGNASCCAS